MKINRLYIKNFRSIKEITIEPDSLCALIGPNGSGKTNVLKALDLLLGEGWTTKAKVARELFNDPEQPIIIEAQFAVPVAFTGSRGHNNEIENVKLEMTLHPDLYVKTTVNGDNPFYDQEIFKKQCHFIYIPSERQLSSELRVSQWTMLGKLMRLVYENYIAHYDNDANRLKTEFAAKIQPAKDFLEADFSATEVTFKKFYDTFVKFCEQNSAGLASDFKPLLNIYNLNWFYKTLQIHVNEGVPDQNFDSEQLGAGMQNLLMLSIFQTYSELMKGSVIFGIEEPEIYLYPHAQRVLYQNFISLSAHSQFFYTTHNPNFIDATRADDIFLLRKMVDSGTVFLEKSPYFTTENARNQLHKIYTHFNLERNELFFAKKVLLVEGDSDKILFTNLAELKWHIDLDKAGISIISCGGKGGVNYFLGVCKIIGHNEYFAVWDQDDDNYQPERNLLEDARNSGRGLEVRANLEAFLSLPEGDNVEKVKNAYDWSMNVEETNIPAEFNDVKYFLCPQEDIESTPEVENVENELNLDDLPF